MSGTLGSASGAHTPVKLNYLKHFPRCQTAAAPDEPTPPDQCHSELPLDGQGKVPHRDSELLRQAEDSKLGESVTRAGWWKVFRGWVRVYDKFRVLRV